MREKWVVTCLLVALAAWPSWAQSAEPADSSSLGALWNLNQVISQDIETLRNFMGVGMSRPLLMHASNVQPPDIFAQAVEFHRKAGRLGFEHLRELPAEPSRLAALPTLEDSIGVLEASHTIIRRVIDFYDLPATRPAEPATTDDIRLSDLFQDMRENGRQLNLLLDDQVSPSVTYMTVLRAISITSNLLAPFPAAERIPEEPAYEIGKTPRDVWNLMLECLDLIEAIYEHRGLDSLHTEVRQSDNAEILPVDVNDLANLLAARLAFLASLEPGIEEALDPVYPGRKFPSHVYVKAGLLEGQLRQLLRFSEGASE